MKYGERVFGADASMLMITKDGMETSSGRNVGIL